MDRHQPGALVLWEQYLVLAAVFGLAKGVRDAMEVHVPEAFAQPSFAGGYW